MWEIKFYKSSLWLLFVRRNESFWATFKLHITVHHFFSRLHPDLRVNSCPVDWLSAASLGTDSSPGNSCSPLWGQTWCWPHLPCQHPFLICSVCAYMCGNARCHLKYVKNGSLFMWLHLYSVNVWVYILETYSNSRVYVWNECAVNTFLMVWVKNTAATWQQLCD